MIFLDSRYSDGRLFKARHTRQRVFNVGVFREWPTYQSNFFIYQWIETDRIDLLAERFLGSSSLWWRIMDINPEISNPLEIQPGTPIRIPNA